MKLTKQLSILAKNRLDLNHSYRSFSHQWLLGFTHLSSYYFSTSSNYNLSDFQKEVLIGIILGDLHISKVKKTHNARLMFKQGIDNVTYLIHQFELFADFCPSLPKIKKSYDKRTDKTYYSAWFNTSMLPIFNDYHSLFYHNGVKIIPKNIGDL
jgi:hypothetical protein